MVKAGDLRPSPDNWRTHPPEQRRAMQAALEEIGFAGAFVVREDDAGELVIIDGHLRQEELPLDTMVPAVITDFDEQEAGKLLATFDPISALAGVDAQRLADLKKKIEFDSHDLQAILDSIRIPGGNKAAEEGAAQTVVGGDGPQIIPEMELQPNEHYDYVLVLATNRHDWNRLVFLLDIKPEKDRQGRRIGIGRAISAKRLIEKMDGKLPDSHPVPAPAAASRAGASDVPNGVGVRRRTRS
jgi:hypothetical protein